MSVKIRISYEKPQELDTVLKLLRPIVKAYKAEKGKDGQYKRAYMDIKTEGITASAAVHINLQKTTDL